MLKIFKILAIACFALCVAFSADGALADAGKFNKQNYPIKSHHDKLGFDGKNCHKQADPKDYKALSADECLSCHKSYDALAERSGHLGYDDNVHASPHYPKMDCNLCHRSHKPSQNYCVMCHSQDSMKKILVP